MPLSPAPRFRNVALTERGFTAEFSFRAGDQFFGMSASLPLFLIREAWERGCSFEAEADGFGAGMGTKGDWSAIRDSSPGATRAMFEKALNHLFPHRS